MAEHATVLIANFGQALQQINTYVALGLAAAISALLLDLRPLHATEPVNVPNFPIPMSAGHAKLILLGICFVAGLMACNAAESAAAIMRMLQSEAALLKAACTYPSVGTAPIGFRLGAALLPIVFVVWLIWRIRGQLRVPGEDKGPVFALSWVFAAPYAVLGLILGRLSC